MNPLPDNTRADALMQEIKCPTCQGQSVYDSQTELAHHIRLFIHTQVKAGVSDHDIKKHLKHTYGEVILFDPPYQETTWILWLGPLIVLMGFFLYILKRLRKPS